MRYVLALCLIITTHAARAAEDIIFDPAMWGLVASQTAWALTTAGNSRGTPLPPSQMYTAPDGTITWTQPSDPALRGYNGRCGEVAVANIMSMISHDLSPNTVAQTMGDLTPGTRPRTLFRYLVNNAPGTWALGRSNIREAKAHLQAMLTWGTHKAANDHSPFAVLLQVRGALALHWVTVVNVKNDRVIYNHSGIQARMPIDEFVTEWGFRQPGSNPALRATLMASCCSPYSVIYQSN